MRNLLLIIVLFVFGSFGFTQVTHNINNNTYNNPSCQGYEFFASFDNTNDCNPSAGMPCFDVPLGNTNHNSSNQSCDTPFSNINDVKAMTLREVVSGIDYVISFCDPSGNQLLNGGTVLYGLGSCHLPSPPAFVNLYWTIDPVSYVIEITIF